MNIYLHNKLYTFIFSRQTKRSLALKIQRATSILLLSLIAFTPNMFANNCEESKGCMDFAFESKVENNNGTSTYCFTITNHCNKALSYVAFSVPFKADGPAHNSVYSGTNGISYNVENTTYNPFLSVKFETYGEGIKKGGSDQFCFELPTAEIYNNVTIEGKTSNKSYKVNIEFSSCIVLDCDNLSPVNGGAAGVESIGTNFPASEAIVYDDTPFQIKNVISPQADINDLEIIWLQCSGGATSDCVSRFEELLPLNVGEIYDDFIANGGSPSIGNTCWKFASDGDAFDESLIVNGISSANCFVRCARYVGCTSFMGESNLIKIQVESAVARENSSSLFENESKASDVAVYPNPAHEEVSIVVSEIHLGKEGTIMIYNRFGQTMIQNTIKEIDSTAVRLNTASLPAGLYTIYLKVDGTKSIGRKLVISRL